MRDRTIGLLVFLLVTTIVLGLLGLLALGVTPLTG